MPHSFVPDTMPFLAAPRRLIRRSDHEASSPLADEKVGWMPGLALTVLWQETRL